MKNTHDGHSAHTPAQLPADTENLLRQTLADKSRPLRLEVLTREMGVEPRPLISAARRLARHGQALLFNGLIFPPALLTRVEGTVRHDGTRFDLLTADGGCFPIALKATRQILDQDQGVFLLVEAKHEGKLPEAVPVDIRARPVPRVLARVVDKNGELVTRAERRSEPLDLPCPTGLDLVPGDIVQLDVLENRLLNTNSPVRFVARLGHASDSGIETAVAILAAGLPTDMPVFDLPTSVSDGLNRQDIRHLPFLTIDGPTSRDLDDALWAAPAPHGWTVRVAIADPDAHVAFGSPVDVEARRRGTSAYLPHQTLPMLPRELSHDICSLNEGQDRPTLCCTVDIGHDGAVRSAVFAPAWIKSHARLTYTGVTRHLEGGDSSEVPDVVRPALAALHAVFTARRDMAQGRLDLSDGDVEAVLGADGKIVTFATRRRGLADFLVEEMMLLANAEAASFLKANGLGFYRAHPAPVGDRLDNLHAALGDLDVVLPPADGPNALRQALGAAVKAHAQTPLDSFVRSAVLGAMAPAVYGCGDSAHFSLALDSYTHFTSPIRRYADLTVHRLIKAVLGGRAFPLDSLPELAAECSRHARRASGAEADARRLLMADFVERRAGETAQFVVRDTSARGAHGVLQPGGVPAFIAGRDLKKSGYAPLLGPYWRDQQGQRVESQHSWPVRLVGGDPSARRTLVSLDLSPTL